MKVQQPVDPQTQAIGRTFTYTTTSFLAGAMFYLLTNNLLPLTELPNITGTIILIGFAFAYGGITFILSRRYIRKKFGFAKFPYTIAVLVLVPAFALVQLKSDVFASTAGELFFFLLIAIGSGVGAWKGIQKGNEQKKEEAAHIARVQKAKEVPGELKNPDDVSVN